MTKRTNLNPGKLQGGQENKSVILEAFTSEREMGSNWRKLGGRRRRRRVNDMVVKFGGRRRKRTSFEIKRIANRIRRVTRNRIISEINPIIIMLKSR